MKLAALVLCALVLASTAADARRRSSGYGWRQTQVCHSASCWDKHASGYRISSHHRRSRHY